MRHAQAAPPPPPRDTPGPTAPARLHTATPHEQHSASWPTRPALFRQASQRRRAPPDGRAATGPHSERAHAPCMQPVRVLHAASEGCRGACMRGCDTPARGCGRVGGRAQHFCCEGHGARQLLPRTCGGAVAVVCRGPCFLWSVQARRSVRGPRSVRRVRLHSHCARRPSPTPFPHGGALGWRCMRRAVWPEGACGWGALTRLLGRVDPTARGHRRSGRCSRRCHQQEDRAGGQHGDGWIRVWPIAIPSSRILFASCCHFPLRFRKTMRSCRHRVTFSIYAKNSKNHARASGQKRGAWNNALISGRRDLARSSHVYNGPGWRCSGGAGAGSEPGVGKTLGRVVNRILTAQP